MNEEDEIFKKCFMKTLKKLAEEPDEVINYNEQLKKYNNLLKEKIKLQQELQRKDNIIKEIKEFIEFHYTDNIDFYKNKGIGLDYPQVDYILDKIKELESGK